MATWASIGHAMRRRSGMPSSHHESAGTAMSRNLPTPEEVLASADHAASPRKYMGFDSAKFSSPSAAPVAGAVVGKKNVQASDPTAGGKANRANVPAGNAVQSERMGAAYRVKAAFPAPMSPEAGATMANARIVRSVQGRQAPNFGSGIQDLV